MTCLSLCYGHKMFSSDGSNDIGWSQVLLEVFRLFASSWPLKMCATLWTLVTLAIPVSCNFGAEKVKLLAQEKVT